MQYFNQFKVIIKKDHHEKCKNHEQRKPVLSEERTGDENRRRKVSLRVL